jgi:hypothetical protein
LSKSRLTRIAKGDNRLVLFPIDPAYRVSKPDQLIRLLVTSGFVVDPSAGGDTKAPMAPGENFMRHLIFVGCSPSVANAENPDSYNNYSVEVITSNNHLTLFAGNGIKSPVCPECTRSTGEVLATEEITVVNNRVAWVCPKCKAAVPVEKIKWRNKLAAAKDYIQINGVFEGEVMPGDKFLHDLEKETGTEWSYCYC